MRRPLSRDLAGSSRNDAKVEMVGAPAQGPLASLRARLDIFFKTAEPAPVHCTDIAPMADGHAGLTFGVDLAGAAGVAGRYILKLAPVGVPRRGSTDIYRQAPLLKALHASGLPVPAIRWASADDAALGSPFIIMERLPGRTFIVWEPDASFLETPALIPRLWTSGIESLADFHRLDWRAVLGGWEEPVTLESELARWTALVRHAEDAQWREACHDLADRLGGTMPTASPVGLVHGDFQPGNILFEQGRLAGVVDWDLAVIGPQGLDIGWYMMIADADAWHPQWRPHGPPPQADLIQAYRAAGGPALDRLAWHQAFAHFRMGAIAGLNLKLHRNGRRVDPTWERFALAIPSLLRRAKLLLQQDHADD
ncbi:phosphotransferase family protein [Vineibacter terrae]|uniref:Phosphotransferase family protein n=1 Tax=Vineibacter terrae TaxID=2586908 RepID=A0A5C8PTD8_9HYPH|nr:phosphotransferase family protein [Vineibacter terrae]TXL79577.1 phosphotransferase family protein [Vineibacter terrae]